MLEYKPNLLGNAALLLLPRPVRSRCRELVTMFYLAWLQRKLAKEAVASASAHTFTHWGVKCGGEEGEAKAAL